MVKNSVEAASVHKLCFKAHFILLLVKCLAISVTNKNQQIMLGTEHSSCHIFWQMEVKQMLKYVGYRKIGNLLGISQTFQVSPDAAVYEVILSSIHV